ncbi:MAG: DUF2807 domain-containing protein [Muribaculaceae bacterium]|nr:DUF2807 domain-containing protein [Muribaculaceae bacterium]
MKKATTILISICIIASVKAAVPGIGEYKLEVKDFDKLTVVDGIGIDYHYRPDSAGYAIFTCPHEQVSHIVFSNNNGHLSVQTDAYEKTILDLPRVKVYSSGLSKAVNSGDSLLRISNLPYVETLKVQQIGNGEIALENISVEIIDATIMTGHGGISISGNANKAIFNNVSSGPIDASKLVVSTVKCKVAGSGNIECAPIESLSIIGAGTGTIRYHSQPHKIKKRGIGVKLIAAEHNGTEP